MTPNLSQSCTKLRKKKSFSAQSSSLRNLITELQRRNLEEPHDLRNLKFKAKAGTEIERSKVSKKFSKLTPFTEIDFQENKTRKTFLENQTKKMPQGPGQNEIIIILKFCSAAQAERRDVPTRSSFRFLGTPPEISELRDTLRGFHSCCQELYLEPRSLGTPPEISEFTGT